ncbi:hypothetical protein HJG60_009586 [Phyllostomus discolor]|uniref:Uncharacterized protein n=1 Tax=Phyllostomus discolor TaxID=89673 RepID=A0A834DC36_9CHIR|nr:hypothetical protein HJG60_009586 [Phyllostomus discolor]
MAPLGRRERWAQGVCVLPPARAPPRPRWGRQNEHPAKGQTDRWLPSTPGPACQGNAERDVPATSAKALLTATEALGLPGLPRSESSNSQAHALEQSPLWVVGWPTMDGGRGGTLVGTLPDLCSSALCRPLHTQPLPPHPSGPSRTRRGARLHAGELG